MTLPLQTVLAPNPGPMTGPGTNQYLLGESHLAKLVHEGLAVERSPGEFLAVPARVLS